MVLCCIDDNCSIIIPNIHIHNTAVLCIMIEVIIIKNSQITNSRGTLEKEGKMKPKKKKNHLLDPGGVITQTDSPWFPRRCSANLNRARNSSPWFFRGLSVPP